MAAMHSVAAPSRDPLSDPAPWNALAAEYDQAAFAQLPELTDAAIELLSVESGDRVLDVAAGPGTLAVRLAPRVGHVMAIDFAERMIERLRGHIMRSHLANLEARVMDCQELEFDDSSFDAAVSMFGVCAFDERGRGLAEMYRVVVPGGRVLLGSWAPPEQNTMFGAAMAALREVASAMPAPQEPLTARQSVRQMEKAGFEQVSTHVFEKAVSYASVVDYWRSFERSTAELVLLRERLGAHAYLEAATRAQGLLAGTYGVGPLKLDCSAILTYGETPLSAA